MEKEAGVCNWELAKRLKELGEPQDSYWWWSAITRLLEDRDEAEGWEGWEGCEVYSAPTVAELGERLPHGVTQLFEGKSCFWYLDIRKHDDGKWSIAYVLADNDSDILVELNDDTLANAMAKMRIYLRENKLIEEER